MNISCRRWARFAALIGITSGCVAPGVPNWAMHVQPGYVNLAEPDSEVVMQLTTELAHGRLAHDHLAPEQIALVGLRELGEGRLADAGLWLSIASYRYHQEAGEAYVRGTEGLKTLPYYVERAQYQKLVLAEVRGFASLSFYDELRVVEWRLRGVDEKETALQDQLATLGKTDPVERESLRGLWAELQPKKTERKEVSRYPALIEAFRARLRGDAVADPEDDHPANYLAVTPVDSLKKEAAFATTNYFDPMACRGVAEGFPALRPAMVAALTATRPQARANAAATLALAPTDETRTLLEGRLAAETDPQVKLVIAYALARHGAMEQVPPLMTALQSCKGKGCELPVKLVQWLPTALEDEIDQAPLARIVADKAQDRWVRLFAAAALRDLGQHKPLEPATIEALIVAARHRFDHDFRLQEVASEAVARDSSLPRAAVVARLVDPGPGAASRKDYLFPCALLARLAKVSTADDLQLLREQMNRFGNGEGVEAFFIVKAAFNIPGPEATGTLVNWYNAHKNLQTVIAVQLLSRGDVPREQFDRLLARADARTAITIKALRRDPDLEATLINRLGSEAIADKIQAAQLAGMLGGLPVVSHLRGLLTFRSAFHYPADAVVRHMAMAALVQRELAKARPTSPSPVKASP